MFKLTFFTVIAMFCISAVSLNAANYFGIGYDYAIPVSDFKEDATDAMGVQLKLENRSFCSFWFGINLNYWAVTQKSVQRPNIKKVDNFLMVSPKIQFNLYEIKNNDYNKHLILPFVGAGLTLSNIEVNDDNAPFGVGGFLNLGLSYGFKMFGKCASFDLEMKYNMPNIIFKAEDRESYQLVNVGLSLGVCL